MEEKTQALAITLFMCLATLAACQDCGKKTECLYKGGTIIEWEGIDLTCYNSVFPTVGYWCVYEPTYKWWCTMD